jgi:N-acetylglutamate synthase-like GNAT family acetyltransferase
MTTGQKRILNIRDANSADLVWINERYREVDFLPSTSKDLIVIAEVDGVAAGLGRIVVLADGQGELGGMVVFDQFKGQGIAKKLVAKLQSVSPCARLFCLPFEELEALYMSMGFARVQQGLSLPSHVEQKYDWCNSHYAKAVSLLVWESSIEHLLKDQ